MKISSTWTRIASVFALLIALGSTGAVNAADLAVAAPVPVPVAAVAYDWTGFYIGGHVGGGWAKNTFFDEIGQAETASFTARGFLGGGQVGFNWQTGSWVYGAEAEWSWARLRRGVIGGLGGGLGGGGLGGGGLGGCGLGGIGGGLGGIGGLSCGLLVCGLGGIGGGIGLGCGGLNCTANGIGGIGLSCTGQVGARVETLGLISGRLGYAWDRTLLYAKGGLALANDRYVLNIPGVIAAAPTDTRVGWVLGAGLEYAFAGNWSAKLEYDYVDLGSKRLTFAGAGGTTFILDHDQQAHILKVGINYRFSTGPGIVAR